MEIEVEQSKLAKALSVVSRGVAGGRVTLPILSNVLIKVADKKVTLTATNLDMAVVDYLPAAKAKDGVITVPAKLLSEFVSNLPKGKVTLKLDGTKVITEQGQYRSVINGTVADDYPELPEIDEKKAVKFKMSADEFKAGVNQVMIAASTDMARPALTGIFFNTFDGALYIAAVDGYRLAERKFVSSVKSKVEAIVPAGSLAEVMRSLSEDTEEVEILFDDTQVRFRLGEVEITSNLIEGSFPDYRSLIPKSLELNINLNKEELMRMTKLAALFARHVTGSIICETKKEGMFRISSTASEYGENASEMPVKVKEDGKVVLNSRYLIDALNVMDGEEVTLSFNKSGNAAVVLRNSKNDNYMHLVMPLER